MIIIPVTYKCKKLTVKASQMKIELINQKMFYLILGYLEKAKETMILHTNKKIEYKIMYYKLLCTIPLDGKLKNKLNL